MKKITIILIMILFTTTAFAQFQVKVQLNGDCVQPDQNTYYVVKVDVENTITHTIVESQNSVTATTDYGSPVIVMVQLDHFCMVDNIPIYKIHVEAAKVYLSPPSVICKGKKSFDPNYSCEDFANSPYLSLGTIDLQ